MPTAATRTVATRIALVCGLLVFAVGIGLLIYGVWLPSTINPYWEPTGMGDLAVAVKTKAANYKWAGGITAAVGALIAIIARAR